MNRILFIMAMSALLCGMFSCKNTNVVKPIATSTTTVTEPGGITLIATGLTNRYWKLAELMGADVAYPEGMNEAYISFSEDGKVYGNSSCNSFYGTYSLPEGNRIQFSQMIATRKLCLNDMEIETKLLQVLNTADNYNLAEDDLILNRARMAPLARFKAVEK
jgi:heat shock protein HslJ